MAKKNNNPLLLDDSQSAEILTILEERFRKNIKKHHGLHWETIKLKLQKAPEKLWSLYQMEMTGGEPDIVFYVKKSDQYIFMDCSNESPKGRRSICYDHEALEARKEHKPKDSAKGMAASMGIEILTEEDYRALQQVFPCDEKTSSWIETPQAIRKLGGALFCDRRYQTIFTYHNGAESYYAVRGFRGKIVV